MPTTIKLTPTAVIHSRVQLISAYLRLREHDRVLSLVRAPTSSWKQTNTHSPKNVMPPMTVHVVSVATVDVNGVAATKSFVSNVPETKQCYTMGDEATHSELAASGQLQTSHTPPASKP